MTLYELGLEYEASAAPLRTRLAELRRELAKAGDPEHRWRLERRIAELTPMLTQCNKLAEFCKNYYEPGYYIGNGPLEPKRKRARTGEVKQLAAQGVTLHLEKRTYTETAPSGEGMPNKREDIHQLGGRTRRKQINCVQELLQGVN